MITLSLIRITDTGLATFGRIEDSESRELCVTLERPWLGNQHDVSCVPAGRYLARRRYSPKHECDVFGLVDVPHRSDIEVHWGCFAHDTFGCILTGTKYGVIDGENCVLESRPAFQRFMERMRGINEFTLDIMPAMERAA